jgi:hypothetical protein
MKRTQAHQQLAGAMWNRIGDLELDALASDLLACSLDPLGWPRSTGEGRFPVIVGSTADAEQRPWRFFPEVLARVGTATRVGREEHAIDKATRNALTTGEVQQGLARSQDLPPQRGEMPARSRVHSAGVPEAELRGLERRHGCRCSA